jgi:nucleotide-binding universal stress UspA family protein
MNSDWQDPPSAWPMYEISSGIMKTPFYSVSGELEHRVLATPRLNNILVPTDFSDPSSHGIEAAVSLLKGRSNVSLTLVHVVDPLPTADYMEVGIGSTDLVEELKKSAEEVLARLRLKYGEGINVSSQVLIGSPIWAISGMANEKAFDLVVMTSHGRSGLGRMFLGSVAEGIIHRANCPVLVVKLPRNENDESIPGTMSFTWEKILVGYDHRPGAVAALRMAEKISERSGGAITLMNVVRPEAVGLPTDILFDHWDDAASIAEAVEKLETVKLSYSPLSVDWKIAGATGSPWDELAKKAEEISADLIVVGPHEHTLHALNFIGSTAQRLVRLAPCSVLAVK